MFRAPRRPHPSDQEPRERGDDRDPSRLSKFLALVLRHRAFQFGVRVDDEGFVPLEDLLRVIHEQSGLGWVGREDIEGVAASTARRRFEFRGEGVRATYGHSFMRPISFPPATPPEHLYIGLTRAQMEVARQHGLRPEGRQYVHLTDNRDEADELGHRKDPEAELVTVRAGEAAAAGIVFHKPTDGIFLSGPIAAEFLDLAESFGRRQKRSRFRSR